MGIITVLELCTWWIYYSSIKWYVQPMLNNHVYGCNVHFDTPTSRFLYAYMLPLIMVKGV